MFDKSKCAISIICLAVVLVLVLGGLVLVLGGQVLVLVLGVRFLSLSWSLGVRSLSLSWSLGVRSLLTFLELIHSFIHSGHFYSAPSSPLLLRGAPDYSTDTVSEFHAEAHVAIPRTTSSLSQD